MTVADQDDFIQEHYDIHGPNNGEYQLNYTIPTGGKAKVGYAYIVPKDSEYVKVTINQSYIVDNILIE